MVSCFVRWFRLNLKQRTDLCIYGRKMHLSHIRVSLGVSSERTKMFRTKQHFLLYELLSWRSCTRVRHLGFPLLLGQKCKSIRHKKMRISYNKMLVERL